MYQQMAENPRGLFVWGEMSEKLKELSDTRYGNAKVWLTDRYDETRAPEDRTYRRTGRRDPHGHSLDTPEIHFQEAPRTNFLATSSLTWFFRHLTKDDSNGGFTPRRMIFKAKDSGKLVPTPPHFDSILVGPLAVRLREIAMLQGEADLTEILPLYQRWYPETFGRFKAQPSRCRCITSCRTSRFSGVGTQMRGKLSSRINFRMCWASKRSFLCLRTRFARICAGSPPTARS